MVEAPPVVKWHEMTRFQDFFRPPHTLAGVGGGRITEGPVLLLSAVEKRVTTTSKITVNNVTDMMYAEMLFALRPTRCPDG